MAASKATGGDFFRHHRDGYKAIHVIRRSNQYGQYLEVSEFHSGSRKGVIRIPAGLEQQGWAQFSLFCKGHQKQATLPQRQNTNDRRREVDRAAGTNKAIEGGKPQIMHQDIIFQKHVTDPGNKAMGFISVDMPKNMVNSRVQLSLELELGCGLDGTWVITRADLQNSKPTRTHLTKNISLPKGPITRPVSQSVWRPKTQPVKITHQTPHPPPEASTQAECSHSKPSTSAEKARDIAAVPTVSDDTVSEVDTWAHQVRHGKKMIVPEIPPIPLSPNPFYALSVSEMGETSTESPEPLVSSEILESSTALTLVSTPSDNAENKVTLLSSSEKSAGFGDEVTRTWGSSSDWVLELRDGKRISIPLSLIRQPATGEPCIPDSAEEPKVLLLEGFEDMGSLKGQSDFEENDDEEEYASVVWEDPEFLKEGGMVVCCEENDRPLEIEPLAALLPSPSHLPELRADEARDANSHSDWVMGKYKEFGEYLGASYEGYEEEVIKLLQAIDARRPQQPSDKANFSKVTKTGGRGSRELKRLTTSVNYDTGSARRRVDPRERGLAITQ